jgi:hypothetical protein
MITEPKREPQEWWLCIENDDPSDIQASRTLKEAEDCHRWSGTGRTHIVHAREVLEATDGKH